MSSSLVRNRERHNSVNVYFFITYAYSVVNGLVR